MTGDLRVSKNLHNAATREAGLGSAVVYVKGADRLVVRNALTLAVIAGTLATVIGLATASLLADAFDEPDAVGILLAISSVYVMSVEPSMVILLSS